MNREALVAMKNGTIDRYLCDEGIDVVIDHVDILKIFFEDMGGGAIGSCTDIICGAAENPCGWVAYRRPVTEAQSSMGPARSHGAASGL